MEIFCSQKQKPLLFPPYCRTCVDEVSHDEIPCGLLLKIRAAIRLFIHFPHIFGKPVVPQNMCLSLRTTQKPSQDFNSCARSKSFFGILNSSSSTMKGHCSKMAQSLEMVAQQKKR